MPGKRLPPIERAADGRGAWVVKSTRRKLKPDELRARGMELAARKLEAKRKGKKRIRRPRR